MNRAARITGLAAAGILAVLSLIPNVPGGPEPPLLADDVRLWAKLGIVTIAAIAFVAARWVPSSAGSVATLAGMVAGALAAFEYHPVVAIGVAAVLVVPGLALAVGGRSGRSGKLAIGAGAAVLAVGAGLGAAAGHEFMYGATHPSSTLPGPPRGAVSWIWAGAAGPVAATVRAKLVDAAAIADLRVAPPARVEQAGSAGGVVTFRISGMRPGTEYRYSLAANGVSDGSGDGSLTTMPVGPASFTVAFSSCARTGSNGAVFDAIRAERPLLYLNLGDMYYANIASNDPTRYRRALDRVLTRPAQANLVRSTASAYVWDDHDFGPRDADRTSPSRSAAHRVYREYVPHYPIALSGSEAPIAQAFTIGRVRFLLTDTRSARAPRSVPDDARKTMLGLAQRAWLERELLQANGRFPVIVWVNPVPWIGAARRGADGWAGYATERAAIAEFVVRRRIRGLIMLSGDTHAVAIDDGTNSGYANGGGGFPVIHAGALDRPPRGKRGSYSHGQFPGGGQYGTLTVEDTGGQTVTATLRGLDWRRRELTSLRLRVAVTPGG